MIESILLQDNMGAIDMSNGSPSFITKPKSGFKTQVIARDDYGNVLLETENITVVGGAQFSLQKIFNCNFAWYVDSLNTLKNQPDTQAGEDQSVVTNKYTQLFGIGYGGTNGADIKVPVINERELTKMVPFQSLNTAVVPTPADTYYFRLEEAAKHNYYLKTFDGAAIGNIVWQDASGSVAEADLWDAVSGDPVDISAKPILTYVEMTLRVSPTDAIQWFADNTAEGNARINEIGLFTGEKRTVGTPAYEEFVDCRLFSKLNIGDELLQNNKGITFTYRVYIV